jgi:hypothetical protein
MRKQFTKCKKPLYQPDKINRASRIAYSKVKNKYLAIDISLYDWETEIGLNRNRPGSANRFDIN